MPIEGALDFRLAELKQSNEQPNLNQPKVNALEINYRPHRRPRPAYSFHWRHRPAEPASGKRRPIQSSVWYRGVSKNGLVVIKEVGLRYRRTWTSMEKTACSPICLLLQVPFGTRKAYHINPTKSLWAASRFQHPSSVT